MKCLLVWHDIANTLAIFAIIRKMLMLDGVETSHIFRSSRQTLKLGTNVTSKSGDWTTGKRSSKRT